MPKLPIPFDNPATYPGHSGVDYGQPRGTIFRASAAGTVTNLGRNAAGGFYIWVQYDNGPHVGYHHMDSHRGCPGRGSRVAEGTQLGHVGNTGNSTGPHLHSEVDGHRTTAGYWQFFDRNRIVGDASGGSTTPSTPSTLEDEMKFLYVDNDGKGHPFWTLLNTSTGKFVTVPDQVRANKWATVWGTARKVKRQDFLNAIDAIQTTA